MNRILALGTFFILTLTGFSRAEDWPRFLGPNGSGLSAETGINKDWTANPPKTLWKTELSDDGYGGPSAADGKVFILDHKDPNDLVRAFDLNTGKEVWTYSYEEPEKKNWGFTRATPTYEDGKLYTLSRMGRLLCLDAKTGAVVWQKDIVAEYGRKDGADKVVPKWQLAGSPFLDGDKLIVCPGGENAAVVALDKKTGNLLWKGGGSDKPGYATPVRADINGQPQYVIFTAAAVLGVNASDGKTAWSFPWKTDQEINAATPLLIGQAVFITSAYRMGCALLEIKGDQVTPVWKNKAIQAEFSTPILYQDFLYGNSDKDGALVCLEAKTGSEKWRQKGFEKGGLMGVDGVLLAFNGKDGDLVMVELNPKEYKELGRIKPLGGQSWTAPILAGGKLIIRNKQTLACLELKAEAK